jgi:hypothetical protein
MNVKVKVEPSVRLTGQNDTLPPNCTPYIYAPCLKPDSLL